MNITTKRWHFSNTLPTAALHTARFIVLAVFIYGVWRYGGTEADTLLYTTIALGVAAVLTVLARSAGRETSQPFPTAVFAIAGLWIAYACLQLQPVHDVSAWFFRGPVDSFQATVAPELDALAQSYTRLGGTETIVVQPYGTVAVDETRLALTSFLLALAFALLGWRLFQTSASRRVLLWTIVIHSSLLAGWGILQHAAGNKDILPGVPDRFAGIPFSSFIYKNAGAAALLPGIASAILLFTLHARTKPARFQYGQSLSPKFQRSQLVIMLLATVMLIGLFVSLSRGAWITAALTSLVAITLTKTNYRVIAAFAITSLVGICVTFAVASSISETIQKRTTELSLDSISSDVRWNHWKDGIVTAVKNFPSGSGLGTYGYAVLLNQHDVRTGWFREAHNQYLEIATESGIVGLLLLAALIVVLAHTFVRAYRQPANRRPSPWPVFGISLVLFVMIQNAADFVITIPSNLFLYAILIPVVTSHCAGLAKGSRQIATPWYQFTNRLGTSYSVALLTLIVLLPSLQFSHERVIAVDAMEQSRALAVNSTTLPENIDETLAELNIAIQTSPNSAVLYERRAAWLLYQYREELIAEAKRHGEVVSWENTELLNLMRFIESVPPSLRSNILQDYTSTAELKQAMAGVSHDILKAFSINSLRPTSHFRSAVLSRFLGYEPDHSLSIAAQLSNSDSDRLFSNGYVYYLLKNKPAMVDQWSRSLMASEQHIETIFKLASEQLDPIELAATLVPANRPDLLLRLASTSDSLAGPNLSSPTNPSNASHKSNPSTQSQAQNLNMLPSADVSVGQRLITYCRDSEKFGEVDRLSTLAGLSEIEGNWEQAAEYWEQTLAAEPRNLSNRIRYIKTMQRLGECQKALDQAILGRSLHPADRRFPALEREARECVSRSVN